MSESLAPALEGGASILVMLVGDSSTGKTRALYEALCELAPNRPFLRPHMASDLLDLLHAGQLKPGDVLWLNETQRFLYGSAGEPAAAGLKRLMEEEPGIIALGTLWRSPYWTELTRQGAPGDPHSHARALLKSPLTRKIEVPAHLTHTERLQWEQLAHHAHDNRLTQALRAARSDRRAIQHLSGGPELVDAYQQGPGVHFTPVEHALITAALDARRLGAHAPLPPDLLAYAADGALEPRHRPADLDWRDQALLSLTTGERNDGSRSDIRCTLTALHALRATSGGPAQYTPADYLEQHARVQRADQLGSASLWRALARYTQDPNDMHALAQAAWDRGLYKHSLLLFSRAVLAGHTGSAGTMLALHSSRPFSEATRSLGRSVACWLAQHAPLTDASGTAALIGQLPLDGADGALQILLSRNPESHVGLTSPGGLGDLLGVLRQRDAADALEALLRRISVAVLDLSHPAAVAGLLKALWAVDAKGLHTSLTRRFVEEATDYAIGDWISTAFVLDHLKEIGDLQSLDALANRLAPLPDIADPGHVAHVMTVLQSVEARAATRSLLARNPVGHVDLADPFVAELLSVLRKGGQHEAMRQLLERQPDAHTDVRDANGVSWLLSELRESGEDDSVAALAQRAAAGCDLADDSLGILLHEMQRCGRAADSAVSLLLQRLGRSGSAIAANLRFLLESQALGQSGALSVDNLISLATEHIDVNDLPRVAEVSHALRDADQRSAALKLVRRVPMNHVELDTPGVTSFARELHELREQELLLKLIDLNPARHVNVARPISAALWIFTLNAIGAHDQAQLLAQRASKESDVDTRTSQQLSKALTVISYRGDETYLQRLEDAGLGDHNRWMPYGREVDGSPAAAWFWHDLGIRNEG
ncbi:hypothetical protein ACWC4A_52090 [Streptomyces mirabilis]